NIITHALYNLSVYKNESAADKIKWVQYGFRERFFAVPSDEDKQSRDELAKDKIIKHWTELSEQLKSLLEPMGAWYDDEKRGAMVQILSDGYVPVSDGNKVVFRNSRGQIIQPYIDENGQFVAGEEFLEAVRKNSMFNFADFDENLETRDATFTAGRYDEFVRSYIRGAAKPVIISGNALSRVTKRLDELPAALQELIAEVYVNSGAERFVYSREKGGWLYDQEYIDTTGGEIAAKDKLALRKRMFLKVELAQYYHLMDLLEKLQEYFEKNESGEILGIKNTDGKSETEIFRTLYGAMFADSQAYGRGPVIGLGSLDAWNSFIEQGIVPRDFIFSQDAATKGLMNNRANLEWAQGQARLALGAASIDELLEKLFSIGPEEKNIQKFYSEIIEDMLEEWKKDKTLSDEEIERRYLLVLNYLSMAETIRMLVKGSSESKPRFEYAIKELNRGTKEISDEKAKFAMQGLVSNTRPLIAQFYMPGMEYKGGKLYCVQVGGSGSIDVIVSGVNKTTPIREAIKGGANLQNIVFSGDEMGESGVDAPVAAMPRSREMFIINSGKNEKMNAFRTAGFLRYFNIDDEKDFNFFIFEELQNIADERRAELFVNPAAQFNGTVTDEFRRRFTDNVALAIFEEASKKLRDRGKLEVPYSSATDAVIVKAHEMLQKEFNGRVIINPHGSSKKLEIMLEDDSAAQQQKQEPATDKKAGKVKTKKITVNFNDLPKEKLDVLMADIPGAAGVEPALNGVTITVEEGSADEANRKISEAVISNELLKYGIAGSRIPGGLFNLGIDRVRERIVLLRRYGIDITQRNIMYMPWSVLLNEVMKNSRGVLTGLTAELMAAGYLDKDVKMSSMIRKKIDMSGSSKAARFFAVKSIYDTNGRLTKEGSYALRQAKEMMKRGYPAFVVEMVSSRPGANRPAASRDVNAADTVKMPTNAVFSVRGEDGKEIDAANEQYLTTREGALVIQVFTKRTAEVESAIARGAVSGEDLFRAGLVQFLSDLDNDRQQLQKKMGVDGSGMIDMAGADKKLKIREWEAEKIRGVYITEQTDIDRPESADSLNRGVRAESLLKTDEPENIATADIEKMGRKLLENLFKTKRKEGYNVLIVKAGDKIRIEDGQVKIDADLANAMIEAAANGLRAVPEINAALDADEFKKTIEALFAAGFTGVSAEGSESSKLMEGAAKDLYIAKVKNNLETLKKVSEQSALGARNYVKFNDDEVGEAIGRNTGALAITEEAGRVTVSMTTEEAKLGQIKTGLDRVMRARLDGIDVSAKNISALIDLLAAGDEEPSTDKIREAAEHAGLSAEMRRHIDGILKRADEGDEKKKAREIYTALGVMRGILRAQAESVYMEAYGTDLETYNRNSRADRDAMGLLMSLIIVSKRELADPVKFKEFLQAHKKEFLMLPDADKSVQALKEELGMEFINVLTASNGIVFKPLSDDEMNKAIRNVLIIAASMAKSQGALAARKSAVASRSLIKSMFTAA
ncbi:MAG: hypothetical protein FWC57_00925, partial [Endomicrobia bacterium]|nr:hypothetical protein [Endomicrobiia bacterium]